MSHKNPRYSQPDRLTGPMPPPEIIEAPRVPRLRLLVALRLSAGSDPVKVALSAARFISTVQAAGRTLRLLVDPTPVCGADGEVMLTFTPARHGVEVAERLEKMIGVVREAATDFEGATLCRVEVVPQG